MKQTAIAQAVLNLLHFESSIFPAIMGRMRLGTQPKPGVAFYVGGDLTNNVTFLEEMTKDAAKRLFMFPPLDLTKLKTSSFHAEVSFFEKYGANIPKTYKVNILSRELAAMDNFVRKTGCGVVQNPTNKFGTSFTLTGTNVSTVRNYFLTLGIHTLVDVVPFTDKVYVHLFKEKILEKNYLSSHKGS